MHITDMRIAIWATMLELKLDLLVVLVKLTSHLLLKDIASITHKCSGTDSCHFILISAEVINSSH